MMAATIQRDQASAAGESTPTASLLTMALPAQMAMQEKGNKKASGIAISRKSRGYFWRQYRGSTGLASAAPPGQNWLT